MFSLLWKASLSLINTPSKNDNVSLGLFDSSVFVNYCCLSKRWAKWGSLVCFAARDIRGLQSRNGQSCNSRLALHCSHLAHYWEWDRLLPKYSPSSYPAFHCPLKTLLSLPTKEILLLSDFPPSYFQKCLLTIYVLETWQVVNVESGGRQDYKKSMFRQS